MKKDDRHHIEIAKEKYLNGKDITVCMVINSGVVYKGAFYSDSPPFVGVIGGK
jgi:hypothetical protein